MKKYICMALAAMALVSCSNDEFLEINQEAISFGEAFVDNATRAYDPSYGANANALTQFNVWGAVEGTVSGTSRWTPIFANDVVEGTVGSGSVWNCTSKTQYWIPGANYKFAAVVNGGNIFTINDGIPTAVTFTSTDGQQDLLYADAKATGAASNNALVNFTFKHMLAKAVFTVTNTTNKGNSANSPYYYKVTDVKILNPMTTGTCTFPVLIDVSTTNDNPTWSDQSQASDTSYSFGNVTNADVKSTAPINTAAIEIRDRAEKVTSHRECLLIPANYTEGSQLKVQYTVSLYLEVDTDPAHDVLISQETKTSGVTVNVTAGKVYSFNATVGLGNPIQFSVTEHASWGDTVNH